MSNPESESDSESKSLTKVLLACIYNRSDNLITHNQIFDIFSKHAVVLRILIFVEDKVWKTLIQLDSIQNSRKCFKHLNNFVIFPDGSKLNIFPSQLNKICFQEHNKGGIDYQKLRDNLDLNSSISLNSIKTHSSPQLKNISGLSSKNFKHQQQNSEGVKTIDSQSNSVDSFTQTVDSQQQDDWFSTSQNTSEIGAYTIWHDADALFQQIALDCKEYCSLFNRQKTKKTKKKTRKHYQVQNISSKVLCLTSIPSFHTIKSIFNVVSIYGKIRKIIHIKAEQYMLVEFQHICDAIQAKDYLNIVKNSFKLFFSYYQNLSERQEMQIQSYQSFYKYSPKNQLINPPSEIINVSYLPFDKKYQFLDLCQEFGVVKKHKWWTLGNKRMFLVWMGTLQQAIKVIGFLQDYKFGRRYIKISFSKTKIFEETY